MISFPRPSDEVSRLKKISNYSIGYAGFEAEFNRITELAANIFNVPISLVSIVGESEQIFKGACGLDISGTDRAVSFCGHAIMGSHTFVIEDAHVNPLFSSNPLVIGEPFIRFYAGAPLLLGEGSAIGSLCLIDHEPRSLSPQKIKILEIMASSVVDIIKLRQGAILSQEAASVLKAKNTELQEYKYTLDQITDAIFIINAETLQFTYVNRGAEDQLGYSEDELLGMYPYELEQDYPESEYRKLVAPLLDGTKTAIRFEARHRHKDGHDFPVEASVHLIEQYANKRHLLSIITDITDRKKAEAARTQFLSNISHDLRTPLSVVIGSAQMLESAPLEGAHRIRLKRLQQASNVLFNLVNDVLDWSKIEAGEIDLEHEPVNLADTFETIMTVMGEVAEEKGIALACDRAADLPEYVTGDAARIQQILFNLVSNAIKFTDEGEVRIGASKVSPHEADNVRLRIEVRDTGVGISSEDQELLFQRFSQVDKSSTRRFQGTGLGLSIVKQLAELMGGGVGVESKPGVGSTFWVEVELDRLDKVPIEQVAVAKQQEKRLAGKHVLLVDDSDLVVELAELMLETAGANISTCTNGQEALDWLAQNPGKADIVLMDVQMPIMDGITAVTIMRSDPVLRTIPVIAMTAGATKTKIDELLDAGMTDYMTKPFTQEQLENILVSQLGSEPF